MAFPSLCQATRFLKYLPNWTTWLLLAAISIYGVFTAAIPNAVLFSASVLLCALSLQILLLSCAQKALFVC